MEASIITSFPVRNRARVVLSIAAVALGWMTATLATPASPVPELFSNHRTDVLQTGANAHTEARVAVGKGFVEFVRHANGSIGVGIAGIDAMRAADTYVRRFNATPLELFGALAGAGAVAPQALVADHANRARADASIPSSPRTFASIDLLARFTSGRSGAAGPLHTDPLCASNDYYLWETLFATPYENTAIDWAGHDWGYGTWSGDANITLGSSSAGTLMICPPTDVLPGESPTAADFVDKPIKLAVHEYVALDGWHQIWSVNVVELGSVYGYSYKGYVVRKLRMTVREFPEFYWWAAAY